MMVKGGRHCVSQSLREGLNVYYTERLLLMCGWWGGDILKHELYTTLLDPTIDL